MYLPRRYYFETCSKLYLWNFVTNLFIVLVEYVITVKNTQSEVSGFGSVAFYMT